MSLRGQIFAITYDRQTAAMERAGMGAFRAELLVGVRGNVIEIGAGTGANLPFYGSGNESLKITETE